MIAGDRSRCHRIGKAVTAVIVWLLLGAIVNVAVAGGLAAWMGFGIAQPESDGGDQTKIGPDRHLAVAYQYHWTGATRIVLDWDTEPDPFTGDRVLEMLPTWCSPSKPHSPVHEVFGLPRTNLRASGWPMLALWSSFEFCFGSDIDVQNAHGGLRLPNQNLGKNPNDNIRYLPLLPIWPGFAINTMFYAFIVWLLFAAPFALRRRLRVMRGLCPKCAYPVGTSDKCTECGAALISKAVPS